MESKFGSIIKPEDFVKPVRKVERVFLHCSASEHAHHDDVEVVKEWHKERGWDDIGYHFFIKKCGHLQVGRPLEKNPIAQANNNSRTIAICLHGLEPEQFTREQMVTLFMLCEEINFQYNDQITFHGHKEVSNKLCPVLDYVSLLGLDKDGNFMAVSQEPMRKNEKFPDGVWPEIKLDDNGPMVRLVQLIIGVKSDGDFGEKTQEALKIYQQACKIPETGFTDPVTWACMVNVMYHEGKENE